MTEESNQTPEINHELLYQLEDKPSPLKALIAAFQHLLASFVGVITPTLIIGGVLGLGEHVPYLISMALIVSGVATFIQARRIGPIGSGLMALQGTSFAFLSAVIAAGFVVKAKGGTPEEILSMIFGVCFLGAFIEIIISRYIDKLKVLINPLVTGIVIVAIGMSLIKVGMTDLAGGFKAKDFGSLSNLGLGGLVMLIIIIMNQVKHPLIRSGAIFIGLMVGLIISIYLGKIDFERVSSAQWIAIPIPFKYGFSFDWSAFIPVAFMYLITAIESSGDLTATSIVSGQPVKGQLYEQRIRGGILADGVNSLIAALFNTFPNTTYSQNNGVIQLTGIASRHVAYYLSGLFILLGLFPIFGALFQQLPKPVIGGATIILFGTVAAAGIRILSQVDLNRRNMLIIASAFGTGIGVASVPDALSEFPKILQSVFGSAITMSGLTALLLNLILPHDDSHKDSNTSKVSL